jgi:hypothetical protein
MGCIAFSCIAEGRDVSQVQTDISWEGKASPWLVITFWDLLQFIPHYGTGD